MKKLFLIPILLLLLAASVTAQDGGFGGRDDVAIDAQNLNMRNTIPFSKRKWGMLCTVYADPISANNKIYMLKYNNFNTDKSNNNNWVDVMTIFGGLPAGSNTQVQYNNNGSFGASPNFTYDGTYANFYSSVATSLRARLNGQGLVFDGTTFGSGVAFQITTQPRGQTDAIGIQPGQPTVGNGGGVSISGANGASTGNTNGGSITFNPGSGFGTGLAGNISFFNSSPLTYGGGSKVLYFNPAAVLPSTAVSSGGVMYVKPADNLPYWWTGTTEYPMTGGGNITVLTNTQSGTSYTLVLSDAGKEIDMSNAAASTLTIPPNASVNFPVGQIIWIKRTNATGLITFAPGAGVTLTSSSGTLNDSGNGVTMFIRQVATDQWDIQNGSPGTWSDYSPSFTGWSVNPGVTSARYVLIGKTCFVYVKMTSGTSNSGTKTITLPFAAANTDIQYFHGLITQNGGTVSAPGQGETRVGSNIMDVYINGNHNAWTASGACFFTFTGFYEIQ